MSLPISQAALIQGAATLASNVAGRVGQAIGFDQVLRGGDANPSNPSTMASTKQDAESLREKITEDIRRRLKAAGIPTNQELRFRISNRGDIHVDESQPRAAEIESVLNADGNLVADSRSLSQLTRIANFSIDLTSPRERDNMGFPGGYPNW